MADGVESGIYIIQSKKFVYVNPFFEKLTGYSREELIGMRSIKLVLPQDRPAVKKKAIRNLKNRLDSKPYEYRFIKKNGEVRWVMERVSPIEYMGQKAALGNFMDITERKQNDEALRASEAQYRLLADNTSDGVWLLDMDLKLIYCSPASEKQSGFTLQEIMEMPLEQYFTPESLKVVAEAFLEAIPKAEADPAYNPDMTLELEFYKKDGTVFWAESKFSIIRDKRGKLVSILGVARDITERKRTEDVLCKEQIMLARTEGIAHVGSWEWDVATDMVIWSDELFRIFQRDPQEGAPSFAEHPAFYHPDDMARLQQAVEVAIADGTPYELEMRANRKDGETRACIARGVAEMGPGGRPVRLVGSLQDITERKQAEVALRESEIRFRELFNFMSSGVAVYEAIDDGGDFIIKDFNPAAEKIEKVSRKDIVGKRVSEAFTGVKTFGVFEVFQRVWQTGEPEYFPDNIYKDERVPGSWRESWVFKLPTGEIVATYNDITARKQTELKLQESENTYRSLFDNMLNGFAYCRMIFDQGQPRDLIYLAVNSAFEKQTGLRDVVGKKITEVIPGVYESDRQVIETYGRVALTGIPETFEVYVVAMGQWFDISVYSPQKEYFVAVFDVITERKLEENKLAESALQLAAANEELRSALANQEVLLKEVHHRVRNNLMVISSLLNLQIRETADQSARASLQESVARVMSMGMIHEQLLQSGQYTNVDCTSYISSLVSNARNSLAPYNKNLTLTVDVQPGITIGLDRAVSLGLIINELVSNSFEHAFQGCEKGEISISYRHYEDQVQLSIKDSGMGVPGEVDMDNPPSLGLQLVNMLVKQLQGTIKYERDNGSKFTIMFRTKPESIKEVK
jgi:PAS domain S-box-containing protein